MSSTIHQIRAQLASDKTGNVIAAIENLRNSTVVEIVPDLVELLHSTRNSEVRSKVIEFLNDLKNQEATLFIMQSIKNKRYRNEMEILISSCWQSGLDYSAYFEDFIEIIIFASFQIAFEAFTVIENNLEKIPRKSRLNSIKLIKSKAQGITDDKIALVEELGKMLETA